MLQEKEVRQHKIKTENTICFMKVLMYYFKFKSWEFYEEKIPQTCNGSYILLFKPSKKLHQVKTAKDGSEIC